MSNFDNFQKDEVEGEVRTDLANGKTRVCASDYSDTMRSVGVIGKDGEFKSKGCPIFIGKTACDVCPVHEPPADGEVTPYIGGLIGW